MKGLSTLVEVLMRGNILNISPSTLRKDIFIVTFVDGTQCNIDNVILAKLDNTLNKINN